jgi:hypothetical protein
MKTLDVNVHDNIIPEDQRKEIWKYINSQPWYARWKPNPEQMYTYVPSDVLPHHSPAMGWFLPHMWMHRACLASDDASLKTMHPVIWDLWCKINSQLGDKYIIAGSEEDMSVYPEDNPAWQPPPTADPTLKQGWRVYTNGQGSENVKRSHGVHCDTVDMTNDTTRTILYVANLEWYPSWFAECIFYPNHDDAGDHQQWQKLLGHQGRNFDIGWADNGKIVSPVPGRIIDYDGRTLHTTRPTAIWAKEMRKVVVFRVKLKT